MELRQHGVGRGPDDPLYAQARARMQRLLAEAERQRQAAPAVQSRPANPEHRKGPGRPALARLLQRARAVIRAKIERLGVVGPVQPGRKRTLL